MAFRRAGKVKSDYTRHNRVDLIRGGHTYFEKLEALIDGARQTIHLQTYIYTFDDTGKRILAALERAAARGVGVYLLLDGYGSEQLTARWTKSLAAKGIHFRWFAPILHTRKFYFGRRLHHKIFVADATRSLVGGINVSNRYNDMPGDPAWLDWALYCEGEASAKLFLVCTDLWARSSWSTKKPELITANLTATLPDSVCMVRVRRNDWVRRHMQVARSYMEMFANAEDHITIMSSYFLPGRSFRKAMRKAIERGVKITVIASGKSDVFTAKQAERYLYRWLLQNGVALYEYQTHVLHGKLSTYDGKWVTVGSYNVNDISTYASIELNLDILNIPFAQQVEHELQTIIDQHCMRITSDYYEAHNSFLKRVFQKACYQFIRMVFVLFTFYFRQLKQTN
jgi:cardiolipin synthase